MKQSILVTGGGGFLGKHICQQFIDRGYRVRSFSRKHYDELTHMGVEQFCGDIASPQDLRLAMCGVSGVVHTAAKVAMWGRYPDFTAVNIEGTKNVFTTALSLGIPKLIYTSSPSVVFAGQSIEGEDEALRYPSKYLGYYPQTKAKAEQLVLKSHSHGKFHTIALRPHLIWGVGEPHFTPNLIALAQKGRLKSIGDRTNYVDIIHVKNAALCSLFSF